MPTPRGPPQRSSGQRYTPTDPIQQELQRLGIMLGIYLQDMETFSVDIGHLLAHKIPHQRMFKGINMLWLMHVQYKAKLREAERREDEEGIILYTWFDKYFDDVVSTALRNFHAYQKSPRAQLTPQLRESYETATRPPTRRERLFDRIRQKRADAAKESLPPGSLDLPDGGQPYVETADETASSTPPAPVTEETGTEKK